MSKISTIRNLTILAVLFAGLVVSGCVSDAPAETTKPVSAAESTLASEAVGITETEVMDIESDIAELEALLSEMNMDENLTLEGI